MFTVCSPVGPQLWIYGLQSGFGLYTHRISFSHIYNMSTNTKHRPVIGGLQQKTTSRKLATTFKHGPVQGSTMLLIALALANASRCLVQTDDLTSSNIKHYKTVITNTWDHLVFLWCLVCIDNIEGSYLYYLVPISWIHVSFVSKAPMVPLWLCCGSIWHCTWRAGWFVFQGRGLPFAEPMSSVSCPQMVVQGLDVLSSCWYWVLFVFIEGMEDGNPRFRFYTELVWPAVRSGCFLLAWQWLDHHARWW